MKVMAKVVGKQKKTQTKNEVCKIYLNNEVKRSSHLLTKKKVKVQIVQIKIA